MDRRRFSPSAEGLEGRALMSGLFGGKATTRTNTVNLQDLPVTFQQKENRIAHLPYYLRQEDTSRYLPPDTIKSLQTDLQAILARLHAPTTKVVNDFNSGLRHLLPYKTLSRENAVKLNHAFGGVLGRAGATADQVANLQADMNALAKVDANSSEPAVLAREDYALVLQTALSIGRPMPTPTPALLDSKDGVRAKDNASGVTSDHTPTMVGTYQAGATTIGYVRMQIIDQNGNVLGSGTVNSSGTYSVKLDPLADGTYQLRTRAQDEVGHVSAPSPHAFALKIVPKHHASTVTTAALAPVSTVTRTTVSSISSQVKTA